MNARERFIIWTEFKIRVSANDEHVNQRIRIFFKIIFPHYVILKHALRISTCAFPICAFYILNAYILVALRTKSAKTDMQTNIHSMLERSTTKSIVDQDLSLPPVVMQSPSMTSQRLTSMAHQTRQYLFTFSVDIVFLLVFM